ncbi:MAG: MBL fold metallo-hydrolase [Epsilonproteobacteria bacterium]|nr:MAG: MBL fold metallo-hydrolase [Campylobacterota bacterium]RLA66934.1 MAG: MBL fold metallo-hydrolase [Campylobacterota bacterium]
MKIKFLGATGTVTGSKYLLTHNRKKILVDCGLFQGLKKLRLRNWGEFPVNIGEISAIILTHAHIDHSGYVPRLYREGFRGKIYTTPGTRELCKILLPDSGFLMEEEAMYANKKGFSKHKPALPLFTIEDARDSLSHFRSVPFNKKFELGDGLSFEFKNAGHILGSAHLIITDGNKSITFSGDIGRSNDPLLLPPEPPSETDYLVIESTYGNRIHSDLDPAEELLRVVERTIKRGGTVLIPAFAVGRSQAILYYLSKLKQQNKLPDVPIFLNSPMAQDVTDLYCHYGSNQKLSSEELQTVCYLADYVTSADDSKKLNYDVSPKIIISASGMITGGRVVHHLKAFGPDEKSTILFTGYQATGTRGQAILSGKKSIKIHGEYIEINAEVAYLDSLSAHADQKELLEWAKKFKTPPQKTFITHGEEQSSEVLKELLISELDLDCVKPQYLDEFEL